MIISYWGAGELVRSSNCYIYSALQGRHSLGLPCEASPIQPPLSLLGKRGLFLDLSLGTVADLYCRPFCPWKPQEQWCQMSGRRWGLSTQCPLFRDGVRAPRRCPRGVARYQPGAATAIFLRMKNNLKTLPVRNVQ